MEKKSRKKMSNNKNNAQLDPETKESILNSKLIDITKLFAIISSSDGKITKEESDYVLTFFQNYYPDKIAEYLFKKFLKFSKETELLDSISDTINKESTYGEKVFYFMKILELILIEKKEFYAKKFGLAKKIASKIKIQAIDLEVLEKFYNGEILSQEFTSNSKISHISISNNLDTCDVYMPFQNTDIHIFKIEKFYCMFQRDKSCNIKIHKFHIRPGLIFKVAYGVDIQINHYSIAFEDLKLYFHIKHNNTPDRIFYLNREKVDITFKNKLSPQSILQITLTGSLIKLNPLKENITVKIGRKLAYGESIYVNLNNFIQINSSYLNIRKIVYQELFEKDFIHILPDKKSYRISNYGGDIYISDKQEIKWNVHIYMKNDSFFISIGNYHHYFYIIRGDKVFRIVKNFQIEETLGGKKKRSKKLESIKNEFEILDDDIIFIAGSIIKCNLKDNIFEKTIFSFRNFTGENISYDFPDSTNAIENVSFEADRGDLVCIMGPSGCGKSTLLKILSGELSQKKGELFVDNFKFKSHYEQIFPFISYVPQDDSLFENLTVYENLYYSAKLRDPENTKENLDLKTNEVLRQIGLLNKKDMRVGSENDKILSGGERKRLNIGFELLEKENIIYLFDEPTSGLSSKDSENVIDVLKKFALKGKIIFVVIHQPSSKIYKNFNKVILLDYGGKLAFFGNIYTGLRYFNNFRSFGKKSEIECSVCNRVEPDFLLDSLEEPLRDIDGTVLHQRKYSPEFWAEKYLTFKDKLKKITIPTKNPMPVIPMKTARAKGKFRQFCTLFERNFINKLRDRSNLIITFFVSPVLAVIIAFILKYSTDDKYTLYDNIHLSTFIFIMVLVSLFLSIANSVDEIIKDSALRKREKMININNIRYLISKFSTLLTFAIIQNIMFVIISFPILRLKELYIPYILYMSIISATGISLGLFISSIPSFTSKAAQNIVPLILIPQIIFGGALIKYKEMNKNFTMSKTSPIPEICQLMPSKWAYEGIMVMQDKYSSYHSTKDILQNKLDNLIDNRKKYILKYGKEKYSKDKFDLMDVEIPNLRKKYKQDYGNREIHVAMELGLENFNKQIDRIQKKDAEISKYDAEKQMVYPMFTKRKFIPILNIYISTPFYNIGVLLLSSFIFNILTFLNLNFRENVLYFQKRLGFKIKKTKLKKRK